MNQSIGDVISTPGGKTAFLHVWSERVSRADVACCWCCFSNFLSVCSVAGGGEGGGGDCAMLQASTLCTLWKSTEPLVAR